MSNARTTSIDFYDLNPFARAYVEAALWSSIDDEGEPLDSNHDGESIHPDTLARMAADCAAFETRHAVLLARAYRRYGPTSDGATPEERAGHDFWLTRNGHGVGFWDRDLGPVGDALSDAANAFGQVDLYVGDDGCVHA